MNETDSTVTAFSFFAAEDVAAVKRKGGDGMKRNVDLNEISDGRLYSANDMVKVECGDCAGCSACCQNMGTPKISVLKSGTTFSLNFSGTATFTIIFIFLLNIQIIMVQDQLVFLLL